MNSASTRDPAIDRAARLLLAIAGEDETVDLAAHARSLDMPLSTAYRIATTLARHGLLAPGSRGFYGPGLALATVAERACRHSILARTVRPLLRRLARATCATAHLGVFEGDMVTYLVKESHRGHLFTREGGQLEAYCSAIGKVLLASLEPPAIERYLASAPFVALTARTMIDPDEIRRGLLRVATVGYGVDDEEIADDLVCVAVPVRDPGGEVIAAVSLSRSATRNGWNEPPPPLIACAHAIEARLGTTAGR